MVETLGLTPVSIRLGRPDPGFWSNCEQRFSAPLRGIKSILHFAAPHPRIIWCKRVPLPASQPLSTLEKAAPVERASLAVAAAAINDILPLRSMSAKKGA